MCTFAAKNVNSGCDNMCWCFEEISLMILVQRILMYLWYRLLLKMFPRLSVLPNCHECSPRRSLPCGQLADEYWKASYFSRTLPKFQGTCYEKGPHQQPFTATSGFCNHIQEPTCGMDLNELDDGKQFNFNCSDISNIYQSTFLEEFDECFMAGDIAWDVPVPDPKPNNLPVEEQLQLSLLLDDYYIDDDLDDHLHLAEYHTACGNSLFGESWMD